MDVIGNDGKPTSLDFDSPARSTMVDGVTVERIDESRIVIYWTNYPVVAFGLPRSFRSLTAENDAWREISFSPTSSRIAVVGVSDRSRLFVTRREERSSGDAWIELHKSDGSSLDAATPVNLCLLNDRTGLLVFRSRDYAHPPAPRPMRGDYVGEFDVPENHKFALCRVSLETGEVSKLGEWNSDTYNLWIGAVDKSGTFAVANSKTIYFYRLPS